MRDPLLLDELRELVDVAAQPLELALGERLEQLRLLENGIPIFVAETAFDSIGVDTEEDFARVVKLLTDPN